MIHIKKIIKRQAFLPNPFGILINPVYIIRKNLMNSILFFEKYVQGKTLDFGCGSKPYESLFKNVTNYIGIDIQVSGHNHRDSNIDYFYDGHVIPFNDSFFDTVVSFEVLEHIFNLNDILLEINRVLKRNGHLLISIPFAWEEHEKPYDFARYTSFGIENILCKAGFSIISIKKSTKYIPSLIQLFIIYIMKLGYNDFKLIKIFLQILIIFPLSLLGIFLEKVLPSNDDLYLNLVILCKKI